MAEPPAGEPFEPRHLAAIRARLGILDELWRRHAAAVRATPALGSRARVDAALPDGRFVGIYASQAISASLDHLTTWRTLAHGPLMPIRGHLTLLRSALETADRARWHLDAVLEPGVRVGRGIAGRRADQVERRAFEASPEAVPRPGRPAHGKSAVERLAELDAPEAIAARLAAGVTDEHYASATDVVRAFRHERWFRLSSGLAHGREWALAATRLTRETEATPETKVGRGRFAASEPVALAMTIVVVDATAAAVAELEAYVAGPPPRMTRQQRRRLERESRPRKPA